MQPFNAPSLTLDEARLSSGEVFINGQHDPTNRPKPIARAYVDVTPRPHPQMDLFETLRRRRAWEPFTGGRATTRFIYRNAKWAIDSSGCTENFTFGPVLGQLVLGLRRRRLELQHQHRAARTSRRRSRPIATCTCACRRTSRRPAAATRRS